LDGNPSSYYTFCDRNYKGLAPYYEQLRRCFESIRRVCDKGTHVVQMVAFSDPSWQLSSYLAVMSESGFSEVRLSTSSLLLHWRGPHQLEETVAAFADDVDLLIPLRPKIVISNPLRSGV